MGAWIEIISDFIIRLCNITVAPHDGCVDWNKIYMNIGKTLMRRTPRWVRGLKFPKPFSYPPSEKSHPTMGAWIEIV